MSEVLNEIASWAWARHHNVLSWYVRPVFFLPFCWFAYRRSWKGMGLTLVALVTSMAWFPEPAQPSAAVRQMLAVERDYLLGDWTPWKVALALLVPLVFAGLAAALWRRSVGWAFVVVNAAYLVKIAWTFAVDVEGSGAMAHLQAVLIGMIVTDAVLLTVARRLRRPAQGSGVIAFGPFHAASSPCR